MTAPMLAKRATAERRPDREVYRTPTNVETVESIAKRPFLNAMCQQGSFGLHDLTDNGLRDVRRDLIRRASDLAREHLETPEGEHRDRLLWDARRAWFEAREIRDVQIQRFRLRLRYGATDDHLGTYSYDEYHRFDVRPAYRLAMLMDRTRAALGWPHVLAWAAS